MTVAIMQPYFLPYIGYWQLIANSKEFIFFDVVQYNRKSWMNRNRILHPDNEKEFQYISVPIKKHDKGTLIKDVYINNQEKWQEKILGQLTVYKKLKAKNYDEIEQLINNIFKIEGDSFIELCINSTKTICEYLDINLNYQLASEISFDRKIIEGPGDWALSICKKLDYKNYINPHGGYEIFDEEKYNKNNIDIRFIKPKLTPYKQSWRTGHISALSIIDLLMFENIPTVKENLSNDFLLLDKKYWAHKWLQNLLL